LADHVTFQADFVETRSRATTFFRWLLVIPLWIWAGIWGIAVEVVVIIAWFALLFTGRYPEGMYDFIASYVRFLGRVYAYGYVMTDVYAPFHGSEDPEYPVRVEVAPPLESYGRWRVFLRGPIMLLALIALYVGSGFTYVAFGLVSGAPAVNWIVIVNDGRARRSLHRLTWMYVALMIRLTAYVFLLAQDFPEFFSEWSRTAAPATGPTTAPAA
jgi:hypothetical protein